MPSQTASDSQEDGAEHMWSMFETQSSFETRFPNQAGVIIIFASFPNMARARPRYQPKKCQTKHCASPHLCMQRSADTKQLSTKITAADHYLPARRSHFAQSKWSCWGASREFRYMEALAQARIKASIA